MRVRSLNFLPTTVNFSRMKPQEIENLSEEQQEESIDKEILILSLLHNLGSDKERLVLLFELMRNNGYQFDYKSLAKAVHVELRWFMRIKQKVFKTLRDRFGSHISL